MKQINQCPRCGGELEKRGENFVCRHCNAVFSDDSAEKAAYMLAKLLDEEKQEKVANLRRRLWQAVNEKYTDSGKIVEISREIRNYLPDDFLASFFETANSGSSEQINEFLTNIDVKEEYQNVEVILDFMLKSIEPAYLLSLNNLIENAYKQNAGALDLYEKYTTQLAKEAEKAESGVYELTLPRDVFVAYSSKDMAKVEEVVAALERNGISCFVAMRNLRHGVGAVANYEKALETAIDNCKVVLFLSSVHSRTINCDAIKKELPYIKKRDSRHAPAQYAYNYGKMPSKYKMPRVELLLDKYVGNVAEKTVQEFFDGCEWCYSVESAVERVADLLLNGAADEEDETEQLKRQFAEQQETQRKQQEDQQRQLEELKSLLQQKANTSSEDAVRQQEQQRQQEELKRMLAEQQEAQRRQQEEMQKQFAEMLKQSSNVSSGGHAQTNAAADAGNEEEIRELLKSGDAYYAGKKFSEAFNLYNRAAKLGSAEAMFKIGNARLNGYSKSDKAEGVEFLEKAAAKGYAPAQNRLGECYKDGIGVEKDLSKALVCFEKAAQQGNADAQNNLRLYGNSRPAIGTAGGSNVGKEEEARALIEQGNNYYAQDNVTAALACYEKAAQAGSAEGMFKLGEIMVKSYQTSTVDKGKVWLEQAANKNYAPAQALLGHCYAVGKGSSGRDFRNALFWSKKAAEQGNADAQYNIGWLYEYGYGVDPDVEKATEWYQKAATQKHPDASEALERLASVSDAEMIKRYLGKASVYETKKDAIAAAKMYEKAANLGDAGAQEKMGFFHSYGKGVPYDNVKAASWYEKAANQGSASAQYQLGNIYFNGPRGVEKDFAKGVALYEKAAAQGNTDAMCSLAFAYAEGQGVEQDRAKALELYRSAERKGNSRAANAIENLKLDTEEKEVKTQQTKGQREETKRKEVASDQDSRDDFDIVNNHIVKQYTGTGTGAVVPDGVTYISEHAFKNKRFLKSIVLPDSVTRIDKAAFTNCDSLQEVQYKGTLAGWCGMTFADEAANPLFHAGNLYIDGKLLKDPILPSGVTKINNYVFDGANFTGVTLPSGLKVIGDYAFAHSTIENAVIPFGVETIAQSAFVFCESLQSVTLPSSVKKIGVRAFMNCDSLKEVVYQGTLADWCGIKFDNVYANPLHNGHNLYIGGKIEENPVLPSGVTKINACAFTGAAFTSITIPQSVTEIGPWAFSDCPGLTIYCEIKKPLFGLPKGWDKNWLGDGKVQPKVVWNAKRK